MVDLVGGDAGSTKGFGDGDTAKVYSLERRQDTRELANRGPSSSDNDRSGHVTLLFL
jgi:hypothetical protein